MSEWYYDERGKRAKLTVTGYDAYGQKVTETTDVYAGPEFYFWLGADAYPDFPWVSTVKHSSTEC